ncbi:MAG: cobalt-precorrin-5B (C(1))-methyltransferase CbiD [Oscillospiraceae bacterium]|nr:cobalt-precorrin-5B (C(1))-methyltransferase CbiD [Oscillospiraceae bacterium]
MELTRYKNQEFLRCGYTTGSCAAAAAKAATLSLLRGENVSRVTIDTPSGTVLTLDIAECLRNDDSASCAVKKDSGDDPDITNGILVVAEARRIERDIRIDGSQGVGRVTKPGLDQPVGAAAINSVPRKMIAKAVTDVCEIAGYSGGISIIVSIPDGATLARRTFNPRMGIVGGLSIIGTSGIVEPMSNKALIDTLRLEIKMLAAAGHDAIVLTIGNFGGAFAQTSLRLDSAPRVKCSNFLGDAIDAAVESGFRQILIIGHIGKLVKLGIGATNTHSSHGDGRIETLIACALSAGANLETLARLSDCVTTDAALDVLREGSKLEETMMELGARISNTLTRRIPDKVSIGFFCFSGDDILIQSKNAKELYTQWCIS